MRSFFRFAVILPVISISIWLFGAACNGGDDDDDTTDAGADVTPGSLTAPCKSHDDCFCMQQHVFDKECVGLQLDPPTAVKLLCSPGGRCSSPCENDSKCSQFNPPASGTEQAVTYVCNVAEDAESGWCEQYIEPPPCKNPSSCDSDEDCCEGFACNLLGQCVDSEGNMQVDDDDAEPDDDDSVTPPDDDDATDDEPPPTECPDPGQAATVCDLQQQCTKSSECPAWYYCDNDQGVCISGHCNCSGCGKDEQCDMKCGYCIAKTVTCTTDDDCENQGHPLDKCINGECQTPDTSCQNDAECMALSSGAIWACDNTNKCVGAGLDGDPCPNSTENNNKDCVAGYGCFQAVCREDCRNTNQCSIQGYVCTTATSIPIEIPGEPKWCVPSGSP